MDLAQLELAVGRCERVGLQGVGAFRVALDHLGEGVALELGAEVHARRTREVVEPVAVLQLLELGLEHVVERAAQVSAEQVGDLGQAADPQVDVVQAGLQVRPRARVEQEVLGVGRDADGAGRWVDEQQCGCPLRRQCGRARDRRVQAIRGDEVDQRLGVLEVLPVVGPAGVGRQLTVVGLREDLPTHVVERRHTGLTGAGHVDRREVERKTEQVVAQGLGDELVDLVAGLVGRAHEDTADPCRGAERSRWPAVVEQGRVQERCEQRDVVGSRRLTGDRVRVGAGHVVIEHGVAEAVDRVCELRLDRCVDVR